MATVLVTGGSGFIGKQVVRALAKRGKRVRFIALRLLFYPGVAFLKLYFGKRYFLNGWAGFFAAKTQSFYAFLKYAKVLEAQRQSRE